LKNALDWISRAPGSIWKDKPVTILSATGFRTGRENAQYMLRHFLTPFGVRFLTSPMVCIASASEQFDQNDHLLSDRYISSVEKLMHNLAQEIELQQLHSAKE
jgi:chromate reductase, NAD(P)H dehydrogenase (quinone)